MEGSNDEFGDFQATCVLQKRHLPDQPIEYLVKAAHSLNKHNKYRKYAELWIPVDELLETDMGAKLIELFEESKVGLQAVDAYLPKRRSFNATKSPDHSTEIRPSQTLGATGKTSPDQKHYKTFCESAGSRSPRKCSVLSVSTGVPCEEINNCRASNSSAVRTNECKMKKTSAKKDKLKNVKISSSKLVKSSRSDSKVMSITNNYTYPQASISSENPDIDCATVSESDDDVLYTLADGNTDTDSGVLKRCANEGGKAKKKTGDKGKTKQKHSSFKRHFKRGLVTTNFLKNSRGKKRCMRVDREIQFKLFISSSDAVQGSSKPVITDSISSEQPTSKSQSLSASRKRAANGDPNNMPSSSVHKKVEPSEDGSECSSYCHEGRRISVRQSELVYRFKEIAVRKCMGYVQVSLVTNTTAKNALNPRVFQELIEALRNAQFDDSRVVLLTGSGSVFCSGIDLHYLLTATNDRKTAAKEMADSLRDFVNTMSTFSKPIVAAVNGPAVGVGVAIVALCDVVYASDKASFYCPYAKLCQTPEGCSSYTLPKVMGVAMANEFLLCGRKITAVQACQAGLVSQVFWPTSMMQDVVPRVQSLAAQSAKAMESTKALVQSRRRSRLEQVNAMECQLLSERWATVECQKAIQTYVESALDVV